MDPQYMTNHQLIDARDVIQNRIDSKLSYAKSFASKAQNIIFALGIFALLGGIGMVLDRGIDIVSFILLIWGIISTLGLIYNERASKEDTRLLDSIDEEINKRGIDSNSNRSREY